MKTTRQTQSQSFRYSAAGVLLMTFALILGVFSAPPGAAAAKKGSPAAVSAKNTAPIPVVPVNGPKGGVAVIYNGKTAAEGGPEALAQLARSQGMKVVYFDTPAKLPALLNGAAVCMIGGTEDDLTPLLKEFTPALRKTVADWVRAGGSYLGICGGGYIASQGWEEEEGVVKCLGILPCMTEAWTEEADPRILTVTWNGQKRPIYYQYGPAFLAGDGLAAGVTARYDDGRIAALSAKLGKGSVVVSGPHPEADETWLDDDPAPLNADKWTPTSDLAVSLLQRCFGK